MGMNSFYQHDIDAYTNGRRPPEDALCFLDWVPEREITDRQRCMILTATLQSVLERLQALEAKAAEG